MPKPSGLSGLENMEPSCAAICADAQLVVNPIPVLVLLGLVEFALAGSRDITSPCTGYSVGPGGRGMAKEHNVLCISGIVQGEWDTERAALNSARLRSLTNATRYPDDCCDLAIAYSTLRQRVTTQRTG